MNIKTILILGGGVMQLPALRIAKANGWKIILADGKKDPEGLVYADYFEHIDLKDKERMAEMAIKYLKSMGLDGVFTAGTDFSTTVAWVAEKCRMPGIPYDVAYSATDKFIMRQVMEDSGISMPHYAGIKKGDNPEAVLDRLSFPLVVKPVDNMGSRCVRRVDSREELFESTKLAIDASRTSQAIIEEYMEGPELSLDAIVYKGDVSICGIADRHIFFPPYFVEMGHTMPSQLDEEILEEVSVEFKKGIKALGIDNGAAKGDIKITENGVKIGEIAARLSGGYMSGWTYTYSSGIEITEAAMNIAVGLNPGDLTPVEESFSAERAFISIPGCVKEIYGINDLKTSKNIKEVFLKIKEGCNVVFPTNNVEKCGNIISKDSTRDAAVLNAENSIRNIFIRLEPDNKQTDSFIFIGKNVFYNSVYAFKLKIDKNIHALEEMKPENYDSNCNDIVLIKLPDIESETSKDWHGILLSEAYKKVKEITGIKTVEKNSENNELLLGKLFWNTFLKGGIQAGVYIIDTIRERISRNINPF